MQNAEVVSLDNDIELKLKNLIATGYSDQNLYAFIRANQAQLGFCLDLINSRREFKFLLPRAITVFCQRLLHGTYTFGLLRGYPFEAKFLHLLFLRRDYCSILYAQYNLRNIIATQLTAGFILEAALNKYSYNEKSPIEMAVKNADWSFIAFILRINNDFINAQANPLAATAVQAAVLTELMFSLARTKTLEIRQFEGICKLFNDSQLAIMLDIAVTYSIIDSLAPLDVAEINYNSIFIILFLQLCNKFNKGYAHNNLIQHAVKEAVFKIIYGLDLGTDAEILQFKKLLEYLQGFSYTEFLGEKFIGFRAALGLSVFEQKLYGLAMHRLRQTHDLEWLLAHALVPAPKPKGANVLS
mgnify:FL=1